MCISCPHPRGDGPRCTVLANHGCRIGCPHPRGDGPRIRASTGTYWRVVPTRVGMVRRHAESCERPARLSPPAWGWSVVWQFKTHAHQLSPPAWGWSALAISVRQTADGCPHPRGDGPSLRRRCCVEWLSCPHPRGDGPQQSFVKLQSTIVVPTRVGMVRLRMPCDNHADVVPTRVGMVRIQLVLTDSPRCPHPRGDGPRTPTSCDTSIRVVPTRVGMVRTSLARLSRHWDVVPTRVGMVRRHDGCPRVQAALSPPAWGWSVEHRNALWHRGVVPTRVGMVRYRATPWPALVALSPPAWGWSVTRDGIRGESLGCPHPRGDGPCTT